MTMPTNPDPSSPPPADDDEISTIFSQRTMTMISIVAVVAMILGSASVIIVLTDWGLNVAGLIGLVMAALLVMIWFRLPKRGGQ